MKMINVVRSYFWRLIFNNAKLSYSQSGEDMILDTIFCNVDKGFYVDIGANNPYIQSNTHYFYKKGWNGINVDALTGTKNLFDKARPRDINVEVGIDNKESQLKYYMFKSSFYNTFNEFDLDSIQQHTTLLGVKNVTTILLSSLLEQYKVTNIEFLSVDVEGLDLKVFQSNDWNRWKPNIIITEYFPKEIVEIIKNPVYQFLKSKGYIYLCNSATNAFYIEKNFYKERFGRSIEV
jgi:FkbM family methyltransferase